MPLPQMTTRRWMIAVVVVALVLAFKVVCDRCWAINGERKSLAMDHTKLAYDYQVKAERASSAAEKAKALKLADYHLQIRKNLMSVVERPWLPVPPNPPEPK